MQASEHRIFAHVTPEALESYRREGYCHLRSADPYFQQLVSRCHAYYSDNRAHRNVAFRNAAGVPRHVVDVFRDRASPAKTLYRSGFLITAIEALFPRRGRLVFTHSKLSFKTPGAATNWFPHQDNGYRKPGQDLRPGFAVFICLEDMDEQNGCLEVFPGSHQLGTLPHERVIEDGSTGDNQMRLVAIPSGLQPRPLIARKGDVIIFSADTIHQSGPSTSSRRLALIAEVDQHRLLRLDDYGRPPVAMRETRAGLTDVLLHVRSLLSPHTVWRQVKKSRRLTLLVRRALH
jgi:ectoine hydroxylase-related dioxygenase (phytanoyl-CoA dioxygenase family)